MTVKELFSNKAIEGDDIIIKAHESIWDGVLFDIDKQGITISKDSIPYWISYDDMEVWGKQGILLIELNGKKQDCSY